MGGGGRRELLGLIAILLRVLCSVCTCLVFGIKGQLFGMWNCGPVVALCYPGCVGVYCAVQVSINKHQELDVQSCEEVVFCVPGPSSMTQVKNCHDVHGPGGKRVQIGSCLLMDGELLRVTCAAPCAPTITPYVSFEEGCFDDKNRRVS